jgi:hypothetical protein
MKWIRPAGRPAETSSPSPKGGFEQAATGRVQVVLRAVHQAEMAEHVAHAALCRGERRARHRARAAKLGADRHHTSPIGARDDRPVLARIAHDIADRRARRLGRGALGVGQP